jgi:solute carrier family 35 (UDP-sugar transporter), member A1/2/3
MEIGWTIYGWLSIAGLPASLYAVQNLASLMAYQNLDALTYNVLNQTKTLSAALCCYLVMGKRQSYMQIFALFLLLLAALVMERILTLNTLLGRSSTTLSVSLDPTHVSHGVIPILLASFISGLAGALSQKNLEGTSGKNAYLFSMELCVVSIILLLLSIPFSDDGKLILKNGFWNNWTPWTMIPIVTNSMGGIIVGLVTKHAGSVRKGFALIFGIFLSGIIQAPDAGVSREQIVGGALAGISLWIHSAYPPTQELKIKQKQL